MAATRRRWLLVSATFLLVLVVLATAAGWWFVRTYGPEITRERIEAGLASALQRPVRVERVALQPWLGRLALEGVAVAAGDTWQAGTLLEIARITLHVGISSLWRRELVLSRIELSEVDVRYVAAGTAGAMQPIAIPDRIGLGPVTAFIQAVVVDRLALDYQEPATGRRVVVERATVTVRPAAGGLDVVGQAERVRVVASGLDEVVDALEVGGRLDADRLVLRRLSARWQGGQVRLDGELASLFTRPELALRVDGQLPLARLASRAGTTLPVEGMADVRATVRGALPGVVVTAKTTAADVTVRGVRARQVAAEGRWSDGGLVVSELRAQALGGEVRASLTLRPEQLSQTRIRARLVRVSVAELEQAAGRAPAFDGRATLEAELTGDPRNPAAGRGWLRLEPSTVTFPGEAGRLGPATVSGEARLADGVLDVARAEARWTAAAVELGGPVTLQGPRGLRTTLRADLRALNSQLGWVKDLAGEATAVAELRGRWTSPVIDGQAHVPVLVVSGVRLERVAAGLRFQDDVIRIDQARAMLGQSEIRVGGSVAGLEARAGVAPIAERLRLDLDIRVPSARMEDVNPWLPEAWRGSGRFTVTGRLGGVAARWRATGQIQAATLTLRYPLERLSAQVGVDAQGLDVSSLTVRALGVPVTAKGDWRWDGRGGATADLGPASLAELPVMPERLGAAGRVTGQAALTLDAGRLSGSLDVDAADVSVGGLALGAGTARVMLQADAIQGGMDFPAARLAATATGRLGPRDSVHVNARMEDVDVRPVLQRVAPMLADTVGGRASLRTELAVPVADPARAQGTMIIDPLRLVVAGENWQNQGPLRVRRTPDAVHLDAVEMTGALGTLSAGGAVHDGGRLDIRVRGRIPLTALATLRPEIQEAAGVLAANVRIAGTIAAPEATGDGTISDGLLVLRDYPEALRAVRAELRASPSAVRIVKATATVGGGSLSAAGDVQIQNGQVGNFRVAVTARRIAFAPLEGFDTAWDADLELLGLRARALLRGQARLVRGLYARDISLLRLLLERRPAGGGPTAAGVQLDLSANLDDNLVVRTDLARLRAGGTLRVQGTTAAPIVFGTVAIREGQIVFRKHTFELSSASVRFTDPRRIDPELDVRGTARIKDYDVTMQLTGRSDDLRIEFTSSPSLPDEDVLSLVAFGATRAQMGQAGAGAFAGEVAGFLIQDLFGVQPGRGGVDVFEVETSETGDRTVKVGKQLTPQMLMVYSQGLSTTDERRLRVEYQVFGPLRVAGEQDFRGGFGGDVLIRFRFR
ncbi:MAG TPA: translocation/assembly module TamB domain-containing protein [Methylomirabilota bacterium]|nr:translocation/assembly module TamB domain-containing protein [Methylomirabilota bacterium]